MMAACAVSPTPRGDGLFRVLVEPAPGKTPWPDLRFVRQGGKVLAGFRATR
jgi:hypothetical protein